MVGAIFVTWNPTYEFYDTFDSLKNQIDKFFIVDNGSELPSKKILEELRKKHSHKIQIEYLDKNTGHGYPYNLALPKLFEQGCDLVLLCDQDSTFSNNYISEMRRQRKKYGDVILGGNIIDENSNEAKKYEIFKSFFFYRSRKFQDGILFCSTLLSSGTLISKSIYNRVGKYQETLFNAGFDHEYCIRAQKKGFRCAAVENSKMKHSQGNAKKFTPFLNSKKYSPFRLYYIGRANMMIATKYWTQLGMVMYMKLAILHHILVILFLEKQKKEKLSSLIRGCFVGIFKDKLENI